MSTVAVIAPHPDDETLGCGGALLRHRAQGDTVSWIIATAMTPAGGYAPEAIERRAREIDQVAAAYGFSTVHQLGFATASLDGAGSRELVDRLRQALDAERPSTLYLPFRCDVHTDHRVVFDAAVASAKSFRVPSVRRVLAYETPSETNFGLAPDAPEFRPNVFLDITAHLEEKLRVFAIYGSENQLPPGPRSPEALRSLALWRGSAAGLAAAEAFMLLREVL